MSQRSWSAHLLPIAPNDLINGVGARFHLTPDDILYLNMRAFPTQDRAFFLSAKTQPHACESLIEGCALDRPGFSEAVALRVSTPHFGETV